MFGYKPDQGVYARGTTFWVLLAFAYVAGMRFNYWVQGWGDWPNNQITDNVPVLGFPLTPSFLMGVGLFALLTFAIWKVVNHAKLANLLIDTETEMKKVTWPSFQDSKQASIVVIGCVLFMLVFLFFADMILNWLFMGVVF
jgi:preprotein translocase SecE subunit